MKWIVIQHRMSSFFLPYLMRAVLSRCRNKGLRAHRSALELRRCVRGGILADEMGLGKSLQVISLCLVNPPQADDSASSNNQIRAQPSLPPVKRPRKRARTASKCAPADDSVCVSACLCLCRSLNT